MLQRKIACCRDRRQNSCGLTEWRYALTLTMPYFVGNRFVSAWKLVNAYSNASWPWCCMLASGCSTSTVPLTDFRSFRRVTPSGSGC